MNTITKTGLASSQPSQPTLKIIPLGGLHEVGKNMTAIEYGDDIIVIDAGFAFPNATQPGVDYIIPDTGYLEQRKSKLRGYVFTHGHEDHIGAVPFVLAKLPAPMYGARFTLARIEHKLREYHLQTQPQFWTMDPDKHQKVQLGVFSIELIRVTHSIPDACAVAIGTPLGTIIHTGDWRLDPNPIDGKQMDLPRLEALGREGVLLLMSESTDCEFRGQSDSEQTVSKTLMELMGRPKGRIIISAIATNVHRQQSIINAVAASGRKLIPLGRSMVSTVELAIKLGYLQMPAGLLATLDDLRRLPDNQVVIMCTGHQGEPNSALQRMASGEHPRVLIKPTDTVILSSSIIPGNQAQVQRAVDGLFRQGIKIYQHRYRDIDAIGPLHAGGHARRDDLARLIELVKPKYFMPIHGYLRMLVRHAELAASSGVKQQHCVVLANGNMLQISASGFSVDRDRQAGGIIVDGAGIGDVDEETLTQRRALQQEGAIIICLALDKSGRLVGHPTVLARGFAGSGQQAQLLLQVGDFVTESYQSWPGEPAALQAHICEAVAELVLASSGRLPMIIPSISWR